MDAGRKGPREQTRQGAGGEEQGEPPAERRNQGQCTRRHIPTETQQSSLLSPVARSCSPLLRPPAYTHDVARAPLYCPACAVVSAQAEIAREGKLEHKEYERKIKTQREKAVSDHKQHVSGLKKDRKGKVEEACLYAYEGRTASVKEVQQREAEWAQMSQQQRDAFAARANQNREDANQTNAQMRASREQLIAKRNGDVHDEIHTKAERSAALQQKQEMTYHAKRVVRDMVKSARSISTERARLLSDFRRKAARSPDKSPELAAELGLISSSPPKSREVSPYRISPSSSKDGGSPTHGGYSKDGGSPTPSSALIEPLES